MLTSMIEEELTKAGFACVRAASDRGAQRALEAGQPFDVLLTDVNLGEGVTGFDLGRFARRRQPHMRIVYMSGEADARDWMTFGVQGSDYIAKPFTLDNLRALMTRRGAPELEDSADTQTD